MDMVMVDANTTLECLKLMVIDKIKRGRLTLADVEKHLKGGSKCQHSNNGQ